jgi:8-oxo-dGTP pyrophosphatase MutT (NUDIX family)
MKLLFEIDKKNYDNDGKAFIRPSARAIIIKDNKIYMVHSLVYDYYKFPGGGIENAESNIDALIRETKEEAGLIVIKDSIKEYGYVHRIKKANDPGYSIFIQDNFYYICDVENNILEQQLDDYENFEKFTLELVDPRVVIDINRNKEHGPKDLDMIEREAKVLELLIEDGYFN